MPSIRAGLLRFFPRIMGSTLLTASMATGRPAEGHMLDSPGGSDDKTVPPRIVEKLEQKFISLLPLKSHTKSNHASIARSNFSAAKDSTSDAAAQDDMRPKELTVQNAGFTVATEAAGFNRNKPLPLTPMSKDSLSPSPSTTTNREMEVRIDDIEKLGSTGNWTRTSDDISRLI
jgi:hypothetical protein